MAHSGRQHRRTLGTAVVLFSLLLVQCSFGFPYRETRANLSPRMLYRNLDSLVAVVIVRSRSIVLNFELLYKLHALATMPSQTDSSSVPASASAPPSSSAQKLLCHYQPIPLPARAEY
jgi:hypothetical protein